MPRWRAPHLLGQLGHVDALLPVRHGCGGGRAAQEGRERGRERGAEVEDEGEAFGMRREKSLLMCPCRQGGMIDRGRECVMLFVCVFV